MGGEDTSDPVTESEVNVCVSWKLAGSTGLEPAASAVTGQRSNQLNYDPNLSANSKVESRKVTFPHFSTLNFLLLYFRLSLIWAVQDSNL